MLFNGIRYAISPTLPAQRQSELAKLLNANGAAMVDFPEASLVVSNTLQFEGQELIAKDTEIVTDEWVDRSIVHGKLQETKLFSADPVMIFSGVVLCVADLEACDKEVIAAGINALGGLFREGYTRDCTHVLAARPGSDKYLTAMHYAPATRVKVVLPHWFDDCFKLLIRLPEEPYAWPDPPILRSDYVLSKARLGSPVKALVKTAVLEDESADKIAAVSRPEGDIWQGKRILLSSTLRLEEGRLESVEASIQRVGGLIIHPSEDEAMDVDDADVYITQRRVGMAFVKAFRANKLIGTLSWLFHVHKSGIITSPLDQLIHFPPPLGPPPGFDQQKITASNYEGDARRYLKKLIELMGGEFTPQMTAANTAVVAAFIKGEKTTKAREWNIPVVNHTWLEDCFAAWTVLTPAQEKYVSFPPGVNFGGLVGKRGVMPLTEEDLVEIERVSEEMRDKKEEASVEPIRTGVGKVASRSAGETPIQTTDTPDREHAGLGKRINRVSPPKSATANSRRGKRNKEVEEEEEGAEESQPRKGRGLPLKRRRETDKESDDDVHSRRDKPRIAPTKTSTRSRVREDSESEDDEEPRRPGRFMRNGRASGSSAAKSSTKAKEVDVGDRSDAESPHRSDRPKKAQSTEKQTPRDVIETAPRSKAAPSRTKSALLLLDDHEFSSSDDDHPPIRPPKKTAEEPQQRRGRFRKLRADEPEEEEEENPVPKVSNRNAQSRPRNNLNAVPGPSNATTTPPSQKTPLRKQPSVPGPTPGRTVFVEILSPQKSSSSLGRTQSMGTIAADGVSANASPKRNRPGARPRTLHTRDRENESPLSSPGSAAESPPRSNRFADNAVQRSSQPTPIISAANFQRTPSRRQAASKANAKLHENAMDIIQFEKEKRTGRVRGAWEDGTEKTRVKVDPKTEEHKKRRESAVQAESDVEEPDLRSRRKRKSDDQETDGKRADAGKKAKKARLSSTISGDEGEANASEKELNDDGLDESDIRLLTTQVTLSDHILKGLRQLGVKMASKPTECNLLLANTIGRTEKFLCAMATARSIVTEDWAVDSVKARRILPPDKYFLKDPEGERKHKFKLADALIRAQSSNRKLLEGHTFYFTKSLHRSEKLVTYKNVIHSAGGKVILANPTPRILTSHHTDQRHALSTSEDLAITTPLADAGFHIYVPEFILVGILTQKMDWDRTPHRLDRN